MQDTVEVNGIILSSVPAGEADRRLLLLTKELGKISCFARGVRKPTSTLIAATRPFACGRFYIYPGKSAYSLNKCEISEYFEGIVTNLEASAYGCYFLETAGDFTHENVPAEEELLLLYYSLKALLKEQIPNKLVQRVFELKLLSIAGLLPDFGICARCGVEKDEMFFLPSLMQAFCPECSDGRKAYPLHRSALYMLRFIASSPVGRLFSFTVSKEVLKEVSDVADELLAHTMERIPASREMLRVLTEDNG